jgi:hypothetical protein
MSDESFERRLRDLERPDAPDPAFVDRLFLELAEELGFARQKPIGTAPVRLVPRPRPRRRSWPLLAVAALLVLGVGAFVASGGLRGPDDLLTRMRSGTRMIVAVTREHPQVVVPGTNAAGFDVEVAHLVSQRLGTGADVVAYTPGLLGALVDRAHLVMSAADAPDWQEAGWSLVAPVYHWPRYLLVRADAPFGDSSALAGRRVGVPDQASEPLVPAGALAVPLASDQECLDGLESADVEACLTATIGPPDIIARPALRSSAHRWMWTRAVRWSAAQATRRASPLRSAMRSLRFAMEVSSPACRNGTWGPTSRNRRRIPEPSSVPCASTHP